jgi:hypothetical protein
MERPRDVATSLLRKHAADALRRARKLPVGSARNDLRQLAMGLLWFDKKANRPAAPNNLIASLENDGTQSAKRL